ncbi:MAG: hypothetical protein LBF15_01445 [Candidatus Peribacteria bacterium]|jgi:hypothetical protein|nr:hypothetical protein [Candidatus Peribacteria bacterium]
MNEKENSLENEVNNDDLINSLDLPETKEELVKEENKIYDINVNNIDDVLRLLL